MDTRADVQDRHALPPVLDALVRESVRRARLTRAERDAVSAELADHLRCGLEAGRSVDDLRGTFGNAELTGALVGRAKRRGRSPMERARRAAGWLSVAMAASAVPYAFSGYQLRASVPVASYAASIDSGLVSAAGTARVARELADAAREAGKRGDEARAVQLLTRALVVCRQLRAADAFMPEVEGTIATAYVLRTAEWLVSEERAGESLGGLRLLPSILVLSEAGNEQFRMPVIEAAVQALLDRSYAGDDGARLHVRGLRIAQQMKGATRPSLLARALEPVYFAMPANRGEATAVAERFLDAAAQSLGGAQGSTDTSSLDTLLAERTRAPLAALRHYPLTVLMTHVSRAIEASHDGAASVARISRLRIRS